MTENRSLVGPCVHTTCVCFVVAGFPVFHSWEVKRMFTKVNEKIEPTFENAYYHRGGV